MLDTIRAQEASPARLFDAAPGEGQARQKARLMPDYKRRLAKAAQFLEGVRRGRIPYHHFREAMTTDDFPLLFGDVIDRTMLGNYREWPNSWQNYATRRQVRDFRNANLFAIDGGQDRLNIVPEQDEYDETSVSETRYQINVQKRGVKMPFSWEAFVNDDLDAFDDVPRRFGIGAARSEEYDVTELYVDSSGPHASLYTAGNANIINTTNGASEDNPALDLVALQDAMIVLANQTDSDGEPIFIEMFELVVPPALEVTANNLMNAIQIESTASGGDSNHTVVSQNWMRGRFRVSVNPYISQIATSNGTTSWFLFARTSDSRPALAMVFMTSHPVPRIWMKAPNAVQIGGGMVGAFEGDFDTDSILYRIRHVYGTARIDPKMTVASDGSGS